MKKDKGNEIEIVNELNAKKGKKSESSNIVKTVSYVDQVENQLILTEDGRAIDLDEKHFSVDDKGEIVLDEDGEIIASIAKEGLTYKDFITTYRENSKKAMLLLLAIQSNAAPLKRGGIDFAYMTDLLLDHMMVDFSEEATIIWDALSAMQSSRPEDNAFTLTAEDLRPYTNYKSDEALYNAFKKGCDELKKTNLEFDVPDPDHDGHNIMIHWNDGAEWFGYDRKTGERAHFDVYTNDFYRVLMSSSGILHGAHWDRKIAKSLKGYARMLYIFCARNKKYQKYNGAIRGLKELTLEQTRYELKIDNNTTARGIWRRLQEAQEKVNNLPGSEFNVSVNRVPEKGKIEGFRFTIKETRFIESTVKDVAISGNEKPQLTEDPLFGEIKALATISKLNLTDKDIFEITQIAKENDKDAPYMMRILSEYKMAVDNKGVTGKVYNPARYIQGIIQNDSQKNNKSNSKMNDYPQNTYDFIELEKKLLDN